MERLSRRQILQLLGAGAVAVGCGSAGESENDSDSTALAADELATPTGRQMLDGIDHFVILMQENRSFDHFLGALQRDKKYVNQKTVNGTSGDEFNWDSTDLKTRERVHIHDAKSYKLKSPPHTFPASHNQYDDGKNDGFVIEAAGDSNGPEYKAQTMAYYDRTQIPFYYWLAEHFTVFDQWHASVMGPTTPNRLYLNTGTSAGNEKDEPVTKDVPDTIWDQLRKKKISAKSYHAGKAGIMAHALPTKTKAGDIPFAKMHEFFVAAEKGELPSVSYIEPNYAVNDDHPAHNIRLGQAFVQSVYKALTLSPQWSKTLLIVLYDEHGGFYDHVPPPEAKDAYPAFRRFGFRVPAFAAGPTVKKGHLATGLHDHTSILATLALRFGLPDLSVRSKNANVITQIFDAELFKKPAAIEEVPDAIPIDAEALESIGQNSQEELEAAIANGEIPDEVLDQRPLDVVVGEWLIDAQSVGAVTLVS